VRGSAKLRPAHAIERQYVLQGRNDGLTIQGLARPRHHGALNAGVDDVVEVQGVAENDVDDLANIRVRKIEAYSPITRDRDFDRLGCA
jgi:hypothetical protein